jgi:hypothetical protein
LHPNGAAETEGISRTRSSSFCCAVRLLKRAALKSVRATTLTRGAHEWTCAVAAWATPPPPLPPLAKCTIPVNHTTVFCIDQQESEFDLGRFFQTSAVLFTLSAWEHLVVSRAREARRFSEDYRNARPGSEHTTEGTTKIISASEFSEAMVTSNARLTVKRTIPQLQSRSAPTCDGKMICSGRGDGCGNVYKNVHAFHRTSWWTNNGLRACAAKFTSLPDLKWAT